MKPNYTCQFLLTKMTHLFAVAFISFLLMSSSVFAQRTAFKKQDRLSQPQSGSAYLVSNTERLNNTNLGTNNSRLKFSLRAEITSAKLAWVSDAEKNTSHFIIEKSLDGKNFAQAAMIFTGENLKGPQQYRYSDALDFESVHYLFYRIRVVDMNGNFTYSDTRVLKVDQDNHSVSYMVHDTDLPSIGE